jgi:hypothetical protein
LFLSLPVASVVDDAEDYCFPELEREQVLNALFGCGKSIDEAHDKECDELVENG